MGFDRKCRLGYGRFHHEAHEEREEAAHEALRLDKQVFHGSAPLHDVSNRTISRVLTLGLFVCL